MISSGDFFLVPGEIDLICLALNFIGQVCNNRSCGSHNIGNA